MTETPCATRRCAYGTDCTCDFYKDWVIYPQPKPCPLVRGTGFRSGYRCGHKTGFDLGYSAGLQAQLQEQS